MKKILVPVDFSKAADNAMLFALEIAQRVGGSVLAFHVIYPNEGVENNIYDAIFVEDYVQARLKAMRSWVKKFARISHLKNVPIQLDCQIAFPIGAICQTAEQSGAALIVMGTTGATGLRGVLLGSVTAGVLSHSKTPVLVVPPKAVFHRTVRFALATDFKLPISAAALQVMGDMLNLKNTGLNIIHVVDKPGEQRDPKAEHALSEKLGAIPHEFHYLHSRNTVQAIHDFLESTDCNGLITVAHDHSMFHKLFVKSTSHSLVNNTGVPILALHDA